VPEQTNDLNIVEAIRTKTEEMDIRQYLKGTWGGYTKASVLAYLNVLRKQQQTTADTFSRNQQALFEEKEHLQKSNDTLRMRLSQVETQYRNLSEALLSHELEGGVCSPSDVVALKSSISAMEEQFNQSRLEKSQLEKQVQQQNSIITDYALKLEQSSQEKLAMKEMLKTEMLESKKQRNAVLQLTGQLEEKSEEIKFLNDMVSDDRLANLFEKIDDITQQLDTQTALLARCNDENSSKSQMIETLDDENATLKHSISGLIKNIDEVNDQNDRLMFTNKTLSDQLELEYKRSIALIKEKSYITTDKLTAVRKLAGAHSEIIRLESKLDKHLSCKQSDAVYKSIKQTEAMKSDLFPVT